jgi:hypothetical protein
MNVAELRSKVIAAAKNDKTICCSVPLRNKTRQKIVCYFVEWIIVTSPSQI